MTKQDAYAAHFSGEGHGLPIYRPLLFLNEERENRVGDIAFFNSQGLYKWVANVWNREVWFLLFYRH